MNTVDFIEKAKKIHGDKYDYSKVEYKKSKEKVCIICPIHGEFWQTPNMHLKGQGCKFCYYEKVSKRCRKKNSDFIAEMIDKYGNLYDFSESEYKTNKDKVKVICHKHGEFYIRPNDLISGYGCPKCGYELAANKERKTTEEFIEQAKEIHNNKYDYSKVNYINTHTKVHIICPIHGEFLQRPGHHLKGHGCPYCSKSKLESEVEKIFLDNSIKFVQKYSPSWLGKQHLDFYLPDYNVAIECQGIQHFEPVDFASKGRDNEFFKIVTERDKRKKIICDKNNIPIIYFHKFKKYYDSYDIESHNENELINLIYSHGK